MTGTRLAPSAEQADAHSVSADLRCLCCCLQELFAAYNKEKSGTISFEELWLLHAHSNSLQAGYPEQVVLTLYSAAACRSCLPHMTRTRAAPLAEQADAHAVSANLRCSYCCLQELFAAYDKDKNGTISFEELAAAVAAACTQS
jgi:cytochrome c-type biogenesis protein CcmH/NrfF